MKVRKKKKRTEFSGASVSFKTKGGPLRAIRLFFGHRWSLPSGISTLFLMVYVFIYSTDFLILLNPLDALESLTFTDAGGGVVDARSDETEAFKANVGIGLDALVVLYALFFLKPLARVIVANPHLVMIVGLLLFGMTYSVNPQQVLYSVIQVSVGVLIAALYAIQTTEEDGWDRKFCLTLLYPLFLVHLSSLILFFANGLFVADYMLGGVRFGGLPGHPNVAGGSAVIGVWACIYLLFSPATSKRVNLFCIVCLSLFAFTIATSGSGTALTVSVAVVALLIWLKFMSVLKTALMRTVYVISGVFVMSLLVAVIMINNTTEEITETFTSSLGKDSDFTGRTELWDIAVGAIEEKPLLGWSYDFHETVQTDRKYALPFELKHFHNGFLDTAVAGGLVLLMLMFWNMFSYVKNSFKVWSRHPYLHGFVGPLVLLALLNLSEYSLLRPLNVIFQVYLCAYFLLLFSAMAVEDNEGNAIPTPSKAKIADPERKRKSRGGKKYRF